jgi:hypothetical protein
MERNAYQRNNRRRGGFPRPRPIKEEPVNKRIVAAFLLLFGLMFTFEGTQDISSPLALAQEKAPLAIRPVALLDCSFISPLDSYIQERFTQRDRGFGMERIMIPGRKQHTPMASSFSYLELKVIDKSQLEKDQKLPKDQRDFSSITTIGSFEPENDLEKEAVEEIEHSGMKMALYLTSRKILTAEPKMLEASQLLHHAPLRGPVAITKSAQKTDWPDKSSLWKQSLKAMQNFDSDKSATQYEFSAEGKDFIARPVRAQESCLQCHVSETYARRLSAGDPIGVLLYAYTTSAKSTNIKVP